MINIKLFESRQIRTVWNETDQKWYFVVEDVILVLTDSKDPKQYIKRMRQRDVVLAKGWVQIVPTLWVETAGGKQRMGCANAKGLLRIIQSIPSPKAVPFKLWLAKVGSERLDEIEIRYMPNLLKPNFFKPSSHFAMLQSTPDYSFMVRNFSVLTAAASSCLTIYSKYLGRDSLVFGSYQVRIDINSVFSIIFILLITYSCVLIRQILDQNYR